MVKVYAPASIGNLGVGFDALGMAIAPIDCSVLGDYVSVLDADIFNLQNIGAFKDQLPVKLEDNIVFKCWDSFCQKLGSIRPITMCLEKNVPVSSGLGSSACSIVAALVAINCHWGYPLDDDQLLMLMGEMEGKISGAIHFDNVSPCFLGGMRLVIQECEVISQNIPSFNHWIWIVAYPGVSLSTAMSRSVLPSKYDLEDCISHSRFLSGFIHACHTQQEFLAIKCIQDIIAEPYRSQLLPVALSYIRNMVIKKGAVSCGISGAGPTIFILCRDTGDSVNDISDWLSNIYLQNNLGFIKLCKLDNSGARIITG